MIVYREWKDRNHRTDEFRWCKGWFLFGVIPLYLKLGMWNRGAG